MIKNHSLTSSVIIHILLLIIFMFINFYEQPKMTDRDIFLDYKFFDKSQNIKADKLREKVAEMVHNNPLPSVNPPQENIPDLTSNLVVIDTSFISTQSFTIAPRESSTRLDSLLFAVPNLITLRTVFMDRVRGNVPEDTTTKWKTINPPSFSELSRLYLYSDGYKNAQMQNKLNSGGIKISLDAVFDLFK